MTTAASLDSTSVRLVPGEEVVVPLQIRNNGDVVEFYEFEVVGPPQAWTTVAGLEQGLLPGTSTTTTVTFKPPRSADVAAGEVRFGVVVTPTEHPAQAVVPEGVVDVLPFLDTAAELVPRTSQGGRRGKHQVAIDNRGNVPVNAVLRGADEGRKVDVLLKPPAITVGPGEARFVDVQVKARKRFWRGKPITHPFQVTVEPQDSKPVALQGTFVQGPVVPAWLLKLLAALLALLIALALLWFVVLKPTISSQAKKAVAGQVAAAEDAAKQASGSAQQAGTAAQQAADSAADANQTPAPEPSTGPTFVNNPVAMRLTSDGTVDGSYTVPDGSTLKVTDLLLSNPQGDFGRGRVLVDGDILLDFGLENFRDLDYHVITPITLSGGQEITWAIDCRRPGTPPAVDEGDEPTSCDTALYLGGTQRDPIQ